MNSNHSNFLLRYVRAGRQILLATSIIMLGLPLQAGVHTDKIQTLITEGKLRQALSLTDRQLHEDEGNVTFRFLKGLILTRLNELDKARDLFVALTREHPDLPEPYNNLAVIYASQGDFEKAQEALQQAINTHPSYATAHENMGDIYAKMASKAYNQALQLDAENSSAKAKLSLVNDLFFVPKREVTMVETVPEVRAEPELARAPESVAIPEPTRIETPVKTVMNSEQEALLTNQKEARKAVEDRKREQEKSKALVASSIDAWSKAWSAKDAEKYIAFYGKDFTPPKKMSRAAWEAQRKVRLAKPRFIKINISNLKITMLGDSHAQANFSQGYQSDTYRDEVGKALLLKKVANKWLITEEQSK